LSSCSFWDPIWTEIDPQFFNIIFDKKDNLPIFQFLILTFLNFLKLVKNIFNNAQAKTGEA